MPAPNSIAAHGTFRALAGGSFWTTTSTVLHKVSLLAVIYLLARILNPESLGLYGYIASTLAVFATFGASGFGTLANKFIAELKNSNPMRVGRILALSWGAAIVFSVFATALALVSADWIAERVCGERELAPLLRMAAVALLGMALLGVGRGVLGGLRAFRTQTVSYAFLMITSVPLIAGGAYWHGLDGAIGGMVVNYVCGGVVCALLAWRHTRHHGLRVIPQGAGGEVHLLGTFWLPAMLAGMMFFPTMWLSQTIFLLQEGGKHMLAMFTPANQLRLAIILLPAAVSQVVLTLLSETSRQEEEARFRSILLLHIRVIWFMTLPMCVLAVAAARSLAMSFGGDYVESWSVLMVLAASALFSSVATSVGQALASKHRMWLAFLLNGIWATVLLGLAWVWTPRYGALGVALAYLVSYGVHVITSFVVLRWLLRVSPDRMVLRLLPITTVFMMAAILAGLYLPWAAGLGMAIVLALACVTTNMRFCMDRREQDKLQAFAAELLKRVWWGRQKA
jgi:O-antigen/teichoic acid export membrane protein